jgi:hypothetical protein
VPEYNEPLEAQIINGQKMTSKFYAGMMSDDSINRPYENYKKGYADISSEISSIRFQVSSTKNAGLVLASIDTLSNKWLQYQKEHKDASRLTDSEIKIYMMYMDGFWKPLLVDMRALKMVRKK